ncbi:conserved hypothetical protein [Ruegeria lacuscaerulensis ITI-1157]|nr:conserved hypothetical protein [Ruegeria lacuscaerulensis ITI-1157]SHK23292.1 hypothetical protein SAMN05444404_3528 [Ruegeria lacuscaerulensis ITI-1157]
MPNTNDTGLAAFISAKTEIDAMLERLAVLSADHFECSPEDVNWGDVGTLEHYRARLREINRHGAPRGRARRLSELVLAEECVAAANAICPITPPPSQRHPAAPRRC